LVLVRSHLAVGLRGSLHPHHQGQPGVEVVREINCDF
jgi:hypothetical protein